MSIAASIKSKKGIIFCVGILSQFFFYGFKKINYHHYQYLLIEDSWVENLTALVYLMTALLVFRLKHLKLSMRFLLALFFVFIALEELSYGQRLFDFLPSEWWSEANVQAETNVHNLYYLHHFLVPSAYFSISILAAVFAVKPYFGFKTPKYLLPYFMWVAIILICIYVNKISGVIWFVEAIDVESSEFILSVGFLLLIVDFRREKIYSDLQ